MTKKALSSELGRTHLFLPNLLD